MSNTSAESATDRETLEEPADDTAYDDAVDDEFGPPSASRRLPRLTAVLLAALLVAGGFVGGALVQREFGTSGSTTAAGQFPGLGSGGLPDFGGTLPGVGSGTSGQGGNGSSGTSSVIGTVVSVSDTSIKVKDFGGTTHVIHLTDSTQVHKNVAIKPSDLESGATVVVQGRTGDDGSLTATDVTKR